MPKRKNKFVVFLDVDDILIDFRTEFNLYLAEKYGIKIDRGYMPSTFDWDGLTPNGMEKELHALPVHWPKNLRPIDGARVFTQQLKELGCRVVLVTSISKRSGQYRIENLIDNGIYFDEIYFTKGLSKGEYGRILLKKFNYDENSDICSIFVDDMAKNSVEFALKNPKTVCLTLDLPYNKDVLDKQETRSLIHGVFKDNAEMYKYVIDLIHRGRNGECSILF